MQNDVAFGGKRRKGECEQLRGLKRSGERFGEGGVGGSRLITGTSKFDYILLMWSTLQPFYSPALYYPCYTWSYVLPQAVSLPLCSPCAPTVEQDILPEKMHRETLDQLEERPSAPGRRMRKKRMEKSRLIRKQEREDNFERKKQKKDRNLPSNICRQFVSFLYSHPNSVRLLPTHLREALAPVLEKLLKELRRYIKPNQTYIRPGLLQELCRSDQLGHDEANLLRRLLYYFLKTEFPLIIAMLRKLTKKEKFSYFRIAKRLLRQFLRPL